VRSEQALTCCRHSHAARRLFGACIVWGLAALLLDEAIGPAIPAYRCRAWAWACSVWGQHCRLFLQAHAGVSGADVGRLPRRI